MRNQPYDQLMDDKKEVKEESSISRTDLEKQQRMLDNMRTNVIKSTD